jgi:SAM-dependent methyltransferase
MRLLLSRVPGWVTASLRRAKHVIRVVQFYGKGKYCPVCGNSSSRFIPYGFMPRENAKCVHCGALERHRLIWLFLQMNTDLFDGKPKKMLHIAPEQCFESKFRERLGKDYLTADLFNPNVMVKMDITNIQYPDSSFDVIYCSHVLEHVLDDKQAMSEFYRVLNTNRWAILNVPITSKTTYEDATIVDPEERLKAFGQKDHVRRYGPDYLDRLRDAGFTVEIIKVKDLANDEDAVRMGLTPASGDIYYCTK